MSRLTPAETTANRPQALRRSLPALEAIAVNIVKKTTGDELNRVLQGVSAFTSSFDLGDQYQVTICVEKLPKEDEQHGDTPAKA